MLMFFTVCAVAGVVVMVAQLGMMLIGLDHDGSDIADGIPPQGSRGWVKGYIN